ncbi:TPA: VOC family protein [Clostridium botulinum]|uniref:Lactoylglutathione lyase n=1 Tax=Clostridium botulinum (strain Kyoto / Type A2) TaxID=536232 RepID=C1FTZ4_CLOBJ|nr:VOC family protein [Clostridium botulinum]ACO86027.1 lactoylglutathione lyase [Clostridium botulinum A2 str. Kyoto]APC80309.1 glyoxalase/Bleomycin resistance /Dioxygenase superfamily protein [Clostridium botulinum]APH24313.1 glyoxalase/Bleomycin resistance /Dioxygenase superfamily protein [Clostridium botulinum]APQ68634.1 glyoxalase/Bleomycin resistance /Dioxygenase superfamily protein [Clostridium botulinum]AUN05914.1 glyoxalase/bleomycin resistance/dioxygenase family protein [Clostridium 
MSIEMIHHICIQTEKYEESLHFYTRVLGFQIVKETPNFHGRAFNTWIKLGSFMIELQTPKEGDKFNKWNSLNAGPVHMAFMVDNVEQEYKRIKSLGYDNFKLKNGQVLYKVLGKSLAKIKAPEGTEIEIRDTDIT